MHCHRSTLVLSVAGAAGLLSLAAPALSACSLATWFSAPALHSGVPFLGTPIPDTLPSGAGPIRYRIEPGHFGRPVDRSIYGQLVRVERLGAQVSAELRTQIDAAGGRVLLVPWDYAADCSPVPWAGSARWIPDITRGMFVAELREREHWAGDIPTLDVRTPRMMPYPWSIAHAAREPYVGAALTADEMLELTDSMSTPEVFRRDPALALARLEAWARAYPVLAERYPARHILDAARRMAIRETALAREVPLAGTWRFVIEAGGDSAAFFVRTRRTARTVLYHATREELRRAMQGGGQQRIVGLSVLACAALTDGADLVYCDGGSGRQGYLTFGDSTWHDADGREHRGGFVDFLRTFIRNAPAPALAELARRAQAALDALPPDEYRFLPGVFVTHGGDRATFEHVVERDGRLVVRIRGERVSRTVMEP